MDSPAEKTWDGKKNLQLDFFFFAAFAFKINSGWVQKVTTPLDNVEEQILVPSQSHGSAAGDNILSVRFPGKGLNGVSGNTGLTW